MPIFILILIYVWKYCILSDFKPRKYSRTKQLTLTVYYGHILTGLNLRKFMRERFNMLVSRLDNLSSFSGCITI